MKKENKSLNIHKANVKVVCCSRCDSGDIERVVIGNVEYAKCKKCNEVIK